ncbi:Mitochondrial protein import protein MAS5 [Candida viswanathii]|uniref:Mitochondrial protein import protein MAS5 n=1 Tax=Candida viswanathii TaxID=5486 RepID=A0A367YBY8_9ASCO|nr:Mitochondrial protein import protein MAS5 [Candida viswanathii]
MVRETYFYDILSVTATATTEEIARSYKKLALKCHPDKTNHDPELTEKFKEMTRAYEVLRDPRQRGIYDAYGEAGIEGVATTADASNNGSATGSSSSRPHRRTHSFATDIFSQVFQDINNMFSSHNVMFEGPQPFAGFASSNQNMKKHVQPIGCPLGEQLVRGEDIHHTCEVNLSDFVYGKTIKLSLPKNMKCVHCNGFGGVNPMTCKTCRGSGQVLITYFNDFSRYQQSGSCATCQGTGIFIRPTDKCVYCDFGYVESTKIVKVHVPPGANNGDRVILKGEADEGRNTIPGDLVIKLKQRSHPYLVRKYNDLFMNYEIDLKTALLGGEIYIPDYLKPGHVLKIYINVHGCRSINSERVQQAEVVGTIRPDEPKIVKGFGVPVNTLIRNGIIVQTPLDSDSQVEQMLDLGQYRRGNLYINFQVKMPSVEDFLESDLIQLNRIFNRQPSSSAAAEAATSTENVMESNLENIPGTRRNPINLDATPVMRESPSKESSSSAKLDFNNINTSEGTSKRQNAGSNKRRRFDGDGGASRLANPL